MRSPLQGGHAADVLSPHTTAPMDHSSSDTVFEVYPATHIRLDTAPSPAHAHTAMHSAFTDSVPDDYAPELRLAHTRRVDERRRHNERCHVYSTTVTNKQNFRNVSISLPHPIHHSTSPWPSPLVCVPNKFGGI